MLCMHSMHTRSARCKCGGAGHSFHVARAEMQRLSSGFWKPGVSSMRIRSSRPPAFTARGGWRLPCGLAALLAAGHAGAACTVNGVVGAPIGDGATIVCSGSNSAPIITSANGVSLTLTPGATLSAPAGQRAIQLGANALLDVQVGAQVSGAPSGSNPLVTVGANSVVLASGSIATQSGNVFEGGPDTVVSVSGSVLGAVQGTLVQWFVNSGANLGSPFFFRYVSSAGRVESVTMQPAYSNVEYYNEAGGRVVQGILYTGTLTGAPATAIYDSIVVNRGTLGTVVDPLNSGTYSLRAFSIASNIQFTNESGASTDGGVQIARGQRAGSSFGTNHGTINGRVLLLHAADPVSTAVPYGTDQRFDNFGSVAGVEVRSGRYVQRATGSFAPGALLRTLSLRNIDAFVTVGTAEIAGAQAVACIAGGENYGSGLPGGVVEIVAGAVLTTRPAAADACAYNGTLVGAGRLVKEGDGTQKLGATSYPPGWGASRPPTSYSGGTEIRAGAIEVTRNDALGSGPVQFAGTGGRLLAGADALVVGNALQFGQPAVVDTAGYTTTLTGTSSGSAALRKAGTGVLAWQGARGHTGQTLVEAGTLRLSGPLAGPLRVLSGAAVEGSSVVAGALTLDAGATLRVRIGAGGASGFGATSATLAGNLALVEDAQPAPGSVSTVLAIGGSTPASGIFAGLPQGARIDVGAGGYRISYIGGDGNDVTLTRIGPLLAPANVVATPGDGRITLAFDPPPPNGEPVSGYRASCAPGNVTAEGAGSPLVVPGLANGTPYSCSLLALGVDGPGAAAIVAATPRTVPGAPRNPVGAGPAGTLEVAFQPPLSDGGAPVQTYTLTCQSNVTWQVTGNNSPLAILGVPDGLLYTCSVVATNVAGSGPASTTVEIMPGVVPTSVRDLIVVDGDGASGIDFLAPAIGAPILDYRAACQPGGATVTRATPPLVVAGLENGTTYTCEVTARNAIGRGAAQQATLRPTSVMFANGFE